MDVYEKHGKATRLAAEHSPYDLALMLVEKECERDKLAARVERLRGELQYFVDRVGKGEIRSVVTHDRYVKALSETPPAALARVGAEAVIEYRDQIGGANERRVSIGDVRRSCTGHAQRLIDEAEGE